MQVSGGSMSKVRVYEVAKQLNLDPKAVVTLFQAIGVTDVRNHMSSVEPEAVERVKRHLEKQKTHDVVEERIRPTVVKRRAVAKPDAPAPAASSPSVDAAALSEPARRSSRDVGRESAREAVDTNGHGPSSPAVMPRERESARARSVPDMDDRPSAGRI